VSPLINYVCMYIVPPLPRCLLASGHGNLFCLYWAINKYRAPDCKSVVLGSNPVPPRHTATSASPQVGRYKKSLNLYMKKNVPVERGYLGQDRWDRASRTGQSGQDSQDMRMFGKCIFRENSRFCENVFENKNFHYYCHENVWNTNISRNFLRISLRKRTLLLTFSRKFFSQFFWMISITKPLPPPLCC
jgi:hypothetical protein